MSQVKALTEKESSKIQLFSPMKGCGPHQGRVQLGKLSLELSPALGLAGGHHNVVLGTMLQAPVNQVVGIARDTVDGVVVEHTPINENLQEQGLPASACECLAQTRRERTGSRAKRRRSRQQARSRCGNP